MAVQSNVIAPTPTPDFFVGKSMRLQSQFFRRATSYGQMSIKHEENDLTSVLTRGSKGLLSIQLENGMFILQSKLHNVIQLPRPSLAVFDSAYHPVLPEHAH